MYSARPVANMGLGQHNSEFLFDYLYDLAVRSTLLTEFDDPVAQLYPELSGSVFSPLPAITYN
jgi:hypothetical protein